MKRLALIGAGFIGQVHAQNLAAHPGIDFRLIYDLDTGRATALARKTGASSTADINEVFSSSRIDAVYIASSTDTHSEFLRRAADAGVAVLCEKPIDADLSTARTTVAYVEAAGIPVMVDFNRRFDRDYGELKRVVNSGAIGEVELMQLSSRGPSVPPLEYIAVSGGQMRDQTVHFFDLARWLADVDPVNVFVSGSALAEPRLLDYGDVDTSVATLRLPSGALVQIDSVRRTGYGYDERVEVFGSRGMVEAARHRQGNVKRYFDGQVVEDGLHAGWFERVRPTYRAALDAFVTSLEDATPPTPSLRDALKAQAIAEAATNSLLSGQPEKITY